MKIFKKKAGKCLLPYGYSCSSNSDCSTGPCSSNKCSCPTVIKFFIRKW